jgi:hypothetical protein
MIKLNWRSMIAVLSDLTEDATKGGAGRGVADAQAPGSRPAACISGTLRCGRRGSVSRL